VVLTTLHRACEVVKTLPVERLRALILDNAALLLRAPLHSLLMRQTVLELKRLVLDYRQLHFPYQLFLFILIVYLF
jgi:hypothetical protein